MSDQSDPTDEARPNLGEGAGGGEPSDPGDAGGGDDEVVYELDEWEPYERDSLSEALTAAQVGFAWDGTTLVVDGADEAAVERILDDVDEALDVALDPEVDKVAYDLSLWSDDQRGVLDETLVAQGLPHGWSDEGELIVHEEDEQVIDAILAEATSGGGAFAPSDEGEVGGDTGAELLGELFVAADRLMHDAKDHEGTLALMDSARVALEAPPPFGFDERQWETILDGVGSLVLLVGNTNVDEDAVMTQATAVRTLLRPLV
jgi:hypothetical protein